MGKMVVKDGKFYKDGVEVPPEFGNTEQIACLAKIEEYYTSLREGTLMLEPDVETTYLFTDSFKCFCGKTVPLSAEGRHEDDFECLQTVKKCQCGKHKFKVFVEGPDLLVKEVRKEDKE